MWTYEKFVEELKTELGIKVPDVPVEPEKKPKSKSYRSGGFEEYADIQLYNNSSYAEPWEKEPALTLCWHTGGVSGGSCWGGENHGYSTGEGEPEWEILDRILEHFCPNITFIRYKGIMRLSKTDSFSRGEYYGNSTDFTYRVIKLKDLWKHMVDNKLFEKEADSE